MTPDKINALRIKLRNVVWRKFPEADAITVGLATNALLDLIVREAPGLMEGEREPHKLGCACWECVMGLQVDVARTAAKLGRI